MAEDLAKTRERNNKWAREHREHMRNYANKRYQKIHEQKAGRSKPSSCELCGGGGRICFDHDHKTGAFRGWICHRCNVVLGLSADNGDLLIKMAQYLHQSQNVV